MSRPASQTDLFIQDVRPDLNLREKLQLYGHVIRCVEVRRPKDNLHYWFARFSHVKDRDTALVALQGLLRLSVVEPLPEAEREEDHQFRGEFLRLASATMSSSLGISIHDAVAKSNLTAREGPTCVIITYFNSWRDFSVIRRDALNLRLRLTEMVQASKWHQSPQCGVGERFFWTDEEGQVQRCQLEAPVRSGLYTLLLIDVGKVVTAAAPKLARISQEWQAFPPLAINVTVSQDPSFPDENESARFLEELLQLSQKKKLLAKVDLASSGSTKICFHLFTKAGGKLPYLSLQTVGSSAQAQKSTNDANIRKPVQRPKMENEDAAVEQKDEPNERGPKTAIKPAGKPTVKQTKTPHFVSELQRATLQSGKVVLFSGLSDIMSELFVRLKSMESELEEMQSEINAIGDLQVEDDYKDGLLVLVRFEEMIYRASLIDAPKEGANAFVDLIDYGNTEEVKLSDVFCYDPRLNKYPKFSVRLVLRGIPKEEFSSSQQSAPSGLAIGLELLTNPEEGLKCDVVGEEEGAPVVTLRSKSNRYLLAAYKAAILRQTPSRLSKKQDMLPPASLKEGLSYNGSVKGVDEGKLELYIVLEEDLAQLTLMTQMARELFGDRASLHKWTEQEVVLARDDSGNFSRCVALSRIMDKCVCSCIDLGQLKLFDWKDIFPLVNCFEDVPPLAYTCRIEADDPTLERLLLQEAVKEKDIQFSVKKVSSRSSEDLPNLYIIDLKEK